MKRTTLLALGISLLLLQACQQDTPERADATADAVPEMVLRTAADSVAYRVIEAAGGQHALAAMGGLRFDFAFDRDGERRVMNKHLWNRKTGAYRIENQDGADSSYVILFNINSYSDSGEGSVYLNGEEVTGEDATSRLQRGYRSFINDTYWLLAPVKMMDPGVTRTLIADSANATQQVIKLQFDGVGLTPGDTYWMYVNKETGHVDRWAMVLQGNPDAAPRTNDWIGYEEFATAAGPVTLSARKQSGNGALLTDNIAVMDEVEEGMMSNPMPILE